MSNKYMEFSGDDQIFHILNPEKNTKLSKLNSLDLRQIIFLIDNFYLLYRKKLGIDKDITFGFEIEVEKVAWEDLRDDLENLTLNLNGWDACDDGSLDDGIELKSPVLHDGKKAWKDVKKICNVLSSDSSVGKSTGGHIHVGSQILGSNKDYWLNLLKLWSTYENILYRFLYGEFLVGRPRILEYAQPASDLFDTLNKKFIDNEIDIKTMIMMLKGNVDRYSAINFRNLKKNHLDELKKDNTIEFRAANGTINPVIWQNNLNTLVNFLLYTKSSMFDLDTIEKRREVNKELGIKYSVYDEVFLDQALEFCDLIFNNNYDKVYFLKQYLKGFEFEKNRNGFTKAKELTKQ